MLDVSTFSADQGHSATAHWESHVELTPIIQRKEGRHFHLCRHANLHLYYLLSTKHFWQESGKGLLYLHLSPEKSHTAKKLTEMPLKMLTALQCNGSWGGTSRHPFPSSRLLSPGCCVSNRRAPFGVHQRGFRDLLHTQMDCQSVAVASPKR